MLEIPGEGPCLVTALQSWVIFVFFVKAPFWKPRKKVPRLQEKEIMGQQATVPRPDRSQLALSALGNPWVLTRARLIQRLYFKPTGPEADGGRRYSKFWEQS